jgi:2,4-dienoyl-CoA reductase-like NADH-dependent reductase (Old Yellow Enzyme family)
MLTETYRAMRGATGYDFPIWVKVNSTDGIENGITDEDFHYVCRTLTANGADALEVSGNWTPHAFKSGAYFKDAAAAAAAENDIPVILTGGNRKLLEMSEILGETKISFFGMARPFSRETDVIERFRREFGDTTARAV